MICDNGQPALQLVPPQMTACEVQRRAAENPLLPACHRPGPLRSTTTAHRCHEPPLPMHSISLDQHQCNSICSEPETTSYLRLLEDSGQIDGGLFNAEMLPSTSAPHSTLLGRHRHLRQIHVCQLGAHPGYGRTMERQVRPRLAMATHSCCPQRGGSTSAQGSQPCAKPRSALSFPAR
jgi:hypothetical protein